MVREAQRAGLSFDDIKLRTLNCSLEEEEELIEENPTPGTVPRVPTIEIDEPSPDPELDGAISPLGHRMTFGSIMQDEKDFTAVKNFRKPQESVFHKHLHSAGTCGKQNLHPSRLWKACAYHLTPTTGFVARLSLQLPEFFIMGSY